MDGQTVTITCTSINGQVMFGLIGCARSVAEIDILTGFIGHEPDLLDTVHRIPRTS